MISDFTYYVPKNIQEVTAILYECSPNVRLLAGGTDVIVQLNSGYLVLTDLIDINHLPELGVISDLPDGGIRIGATVRLSQIVEHPRIRTDYQALWDGAITVGSVQIRNRATLVGNICNASPAADTAPGLLVYGAIANIQGQSGERSLPIEKIFFGPGRTTLMKGEWVTSIDLPPVKNHGACYLKLGRTRGVDLALVGVAMYASDIDVRAAYSSVAPTPLLVQGVGEILASGSADVILDRMVEEKIKLALKPIDDVRASATYRLAMAKVLTLRAWRLVSMRSKNQADGDVSHAI